MIHLAQVPGHSFFFFQKPVKNIFICSCIIVVAHSVPSPGDIHTPSFPSVQECADDWRRKWQPTPVFLPGESQGRGSLVGCRLWGHAESDMTKVT